MELCFGDGTKPVSSTSTLSGWAAPDPVMPAQAAVAVTLPCKRSLTTKPSRQQIMQDRLCSMGCQPDKLRYCGSGKPQCKGFRGPWPGVQVSSDFLTALGNLHAGWRSSAQSGSQVSVALRPLSWTPGLQQLPRLVVEVVVQAPRPEAVGEIVPPEPIPAARYCEHSVHVQGTCQVLQLEDPAPDAHVHAGRVPVWPRRCILEQLQAGCIP